jgi:hypothetical protein
LSNPCKKSFLFFVGFMSQKSNKLHKRDAFQDEELESIAGITIKKPKFIGFSLQVYSCVLGQVFLALNCEEQDKLLAMRIDDQLDYLRGQEGKSDLIIAISSKQNDLVKAQHDLVQAQHKRKLVQKLMTSVGLVEDIAKKVCEGIPWFPINDLGSNAKKAVIEHINNMFTDPVKRNLVVQALELVDNTVIKDDDEFAAICSKAQLETTNELVSLREVHEHLDDKNIFVRESYVKLYDEVLRSGDMRSCGVVGDPGIGMV